MLQPAGDPYAGSSDGARCRNLHAGNVEEAFKTAYTLIDQGGLVPAGDGTKLAGSIFQGWLYSTNNIEGDAAAIVDRHHDR